MIGERAEGRRGAATTDVLVVIDSLSPGGAETSLVALAPALAERGVSTTIATLRRTTPSLTERARADGIAVVELPEDRWWRQVAAVRRTIRDRRPDVVHTSLFYADQIGRLAGVGTGVPVMSSLVNTPYVPERRTGSLSRRASLRAVQVIDATTGRLLADHFHAVTLGCAEHAVRALRLPADRITVAHRGRPIDVAVDRGPDRLRVRSELGVADDVPLLVNLGRLEPQKAQADLIAQSERLRRNGVDHVLAIAGRAGASSAAVEAAAARANADGGRVALLGHRDDATALVAAADVVVISSIYEGTAGVAIEAMAIGTPVVSTDVEGVRGVLTHEETALLAPIDELADTIERLLAEPGLADEIVRRGRDVFVARHAPGPAADAMAALYRSVAAAAGDDEAPAIG